LQLSIERHIAINNDKSPQLTTATTISIWSEEATSRAIIKKITIANLQLEKQCEVVTVIATAIKVDAGHRSVASWAAQRTEISNATYHRACMHPLHCCSWY